MKRESGVLMHISSLFGDYSIGGFSDSARYFIDFLADCGFTYWQVLPFSMTDEWNSPYKSYSAFAGNPYFIDPETLCRQGLLTREELLPHRQRTPYSCEYARLYEERYALLRLAAARVTNRAEIEAYIEARPHLSRFCLFMALKEANAQKSWHTWTNTDVSAETVFLWQFIQYTFFTQWAEIKAYAALRGIKLIGDMPFYVDYDSADVWGNPSLFQLDQDGRMKAVAGVPPDYFSADGQLWGNPLYDWAEMEKDGFAWWKERLAHTLTLFDGVRIDHFRAMESYWRVPAGAKTAREGAWQKGPGEKLVDALHTVTDGKLIVAEDLGDITPAVHALVAYSGYPGMRVFQFGFLGDPKSPHIPHNYPENCVAYTGTHDNNTLLGYVWELSQERRQEMLSYCGYTAPDWNQGYDSILRTLFMSHARIVILPIQDLLGYGADTRLNVPGRAEGNWQFRVTRQQLDAIDRAKFRSFNRMYGRI
ncbi:MAG: 4-alpha-glucanotransferase [Clostridia bacterium]|nr:4-alpha-glucanotransferase [Clostridia bacterium]